MLGLTPSDWQRFVQRVQRCQRGSRRQLAHAPLRIDATDVTVWLSVHLGQVVFSERLQLSPSVVTPTRLIIPFGSGDLLIGTQPIKLTAKGDAIAWPDVPDACQAMPAHFLQALTDAGRCTAETSGKYANDRVQLQGATGQVIGTDAQQAFVVGGFTFPFADNVLIPAVSLFAHKEFTHPKELQIGCIGEWLYLASDHWRLWLALDRPSRFPDVASIIPVATRFEWTIHPRDVPPLRQLLAAWSTKHDDERFVTVEVRVPLTVRVPDTDRGQPRELSLPNSTATGSPVTVILNRDHWERSLQWGFRTFHGCKPEQPIVGVDGPRQHVLVAHAASNAIASVKPSRSPSSSIRSVVPVPRQPPAESPEMPDPGDSSIDPIVEIDALRQALTTAMQHLVRLAAALKHLRKERRTLAGVYASLRQLQLGGGHE